MGPVVKLVLLGYAAVGLGGCLPLTVASALGMVAGGGGGPSAKGTNSPAFQESQWVKDKGPELYQATEAAVLEECTARIETPTPASAGAESSAVAGGSPSHSSQGNACVFRETCLPGNRTPVRLLVCGPAGRPSMQSHDGTGGMAQVQNWVWEQEPVVRPQPDEE
jgi:hypothetical protein